MAGLNKCDFSRFFIDVSIGLKLYAATLDERYSRPPEANKQPLPATLLAGSAFSLAIAGASLDSTAVTLAPAKQNTNNTKPTPLVIIGPPHLQSMLLNSRIMYIRNTLNNNNKMYFLLVFFSVRYIPFLLQFPPLFFLRFKGLIFSPLCCYFIFEN